MDFINDPAPDQQSETEKKPVPNSVRTVTDTLPESGDVIEFRGATGMDERVLLETSPEELRNPMKLYEALALMCIVSINGKPVVEQNWKRRADLFRFYKDKEYYDNLFTSICTLQREDLAGLQARAKNLRDALRGEK